jgi:hypothetical protein
MSKAVRGKQEKAKLSRSSDSQTVMLESGQIWKAGETYIQIKEAGTRLIHYKMAKTLHRPGLRKHLASVKTVQAFLKSSRAQLLPRAKSDVENVSR